MLFNVNVLWLSVRTWKNPIAHSPWDLHVLKKTTSVKLKLWADFIDQKVSVTLKPESIPKAKQQSRKIEKPLEYGHKGAIRF